MELPPPLRWKNVEVIPLVHGRVAFAVAVRERMLGKRHAALAVELPPSVRPAILRGLELLPRIHAAIYRDWTRSEYDASPWTPERDARGGEDEDVSAATGLRAWYVPIDPCDAIVEALRIARGERVPVHFIDAEVEDFAGRRFVMPDPHALLTLGIDEFYGAALPTIRREHPPTDEDHARERHMAARLAALAAANEARGDVLFLCGMAHWERIRGHLAAGSGALHRGAGPAADDVGLAPIHPASLFHVLGEMPFVTLAWERHRNSIEIGRHDQILAMKSLLLATREHFREEHADALDQPTPAALATMLDFVRKLVVGRGRLSPDLYSLVVAAKGVIGNDFALALLHVAARYPPNALPDEAAATPTKPAPEAAADEIGRAHV